MANGTLNVALKRDWLPANPWLWLGVGLALSFASWAWTRAVRDADDARVIVLALGMLATGVGCYLRWRDRDTLYLQPWAPPVAMFGRLLLGGIFLLLGVGLIFFFGVSCVYSNRPEFYPGVTFLACITISPVSLAAARRCLLRKDQQVGLDVDEEFGIALLIAGGVCVLGWFTLWTGGLDWDTVRLALRALCGVCVVAAAVVVVSTFMRRITLSIVFLLHFIGICNSCLAVEPAPWLIKQSWIRLFRPYLEFMYLSNAYHFYAPDPAPADYIWFRVIFTTPEGADHGMWYKVPDLDENGTIRHPVALEYQRFLALTSSVASDSPLPAEFYFDHKQNKPMRQEMYQRRLSAAPESKEGGLGIAEWKGVRVPFAAHMHWTAQVRIPSEVSKVLLSSFARFIAQKYAVHPEHPDWEFKRVKIYRVVHWIPPITYFETRIPPTDPELYRAYYSGSYDSAGIQREDQDPYLYWMLPSTRTNPLDPDSEIRDYCRLHAGDPYWIRPEHSKEWVQRPPL